MAKIRINLYKSVGEKSWDVELVGSIEVIGKKMDNAYKRWAKIDIRDEYYYIRRHNKWGIKWVTQEHPWNSYANVHRSFDWVGHLQDEPLPQYDYSVITIY